MFNSESVDIDLEIKLALVGDSGVGKTSIINQYISQKFNLDVKATIGESHYSKILKLKNQNIQLSLWDTAGQERYRSLSKIFLKNSNIIIFVYDITKSESFINIKKIWAPLVNELIGNDNIIFGLAANKSDLYENDKVGIEKGKICAKELDCIFKETTSTEYSGIELLINELVEKYIQIHTKKIENLKLNHKKKKKTKCC